MNTIPSKEEYEEAERQKAARRAQAKRINDELTVNSLSQEISNAIRQGAATIDEGDDCINLEVKTRLIEDFAAKGCTLHFTNMFGRYSIAWTYQTTNQ